MNSTLTQLVYFYIHVPVVAFPVESSNDKHRREFLSRLKEIPYADMFLVISDET